MLARAALTAPDTNSRLAALRLVDVHKSYDVGIGTCRATIRALDSVTFAAAGGDVVAVLGSRGAGKSTLLRVAAGLIRPSRGTVHLRNAANDWRARFHSARVGVAEASPTSALYLTALDDRAFADIAERLALLASSNAPDQPLLVALDLAPVRSRPIVSRLLASAVRDVARCGVVVLIASERACDVAGLSSRAIVMHRGRILSPLR